MNQPYAEGLPSLSLYLEAIREQDRSTLARCFREDLTASLIALRLQIATSAPEELPANLATAAEDFIRALRSTADKLRPGLLDLLGLSATLRDQASQYRKTTGIPVSVRSRPSNIHTSQPAETWLFRFAEDILTEAALRRPRSISLSVHQTSSALVLGARLSEDPSPAPRTFAHGSLALLSLQGRAMAVGATLRFKRPAGFTCVRVTAPLSMPPAS